MLGALGAMASILWLRNRHEPAPMPSQENPTELRSAIYFALLFAVVLLATAAGRENFGATGLYTVAALSGLTDMDAITLSTAQMVNNGQVPAPTGRRLILVAAMANLVFKTGVVAVLGDRPLFRRLALVFGLAFAAGAAVLWCWPA
jgi:uncharacterized membrane protein (DUF4010 family)